MIILKWILKKLFLFLDLIHHYNRGLSRIFGKVNDVVLPKTIYVFKYFAVDAF